MNWLKKIIGKPDSHQGTSQDRDPNQSNAYDRIGGEQVIRAIAHQFYAQMQSNPTTQELLAIHRAPIEESEQKLFEFLSGWLGGPQLYQQKHGHPALRARHMPFKVDETMRDQWLVCMNAAIEIEVEEQQHQQAIYSAISTLADHMRNQ
ncbi:group II truncated hemoglobin [Shewanella marinintestina]|uniref:group II truncated hemoglobin n=1 Tax=Shewanella marinintestina TaxID=190305 RepID=UPI00200F6D24|nr:group II truncated hemoglobin [Shewanella marinintestina]MCL1148076.1 group II truncated hemoglobin [Shewanella marinintestina]